MADQPYLDIKADIEAVRTAYRAQAQQQSLKCLVYGGFGSGKTQLLRTARRPVLVDSFDPGGTKTNRSQIEEGWLIADTRWELDDSRKPTVAEAWDRTYHDRKKKGVFGAVGTYAIDSVTTLTQSIVNRFLAKAGRPDGFLFQQDYNPIMAQLEGIIRDLMNLPCDVIVVAHDDVEKDEPTGKMYTGPQFVGKTLRSRLPLLFDEVYYMLPEVKSGGVEYRLLTRNNGSVRARTRLGKDGIFDTFEKPDIKALLKKAGYSTEDKPMI